LILLDKVTGERIDVNYAYGNAGYSAAAREAPSDCANLRAYLAEGYMLNFHFPKFARNDPVTDPEGDWNDVISGWFFSQYTYKEAVIHSALPTECIEKYQAVIDALAKKLEH
jgi:hypothetical protein